MRYQLFCYAVGLVQRLPYRYRLKFWTKLYYYNLKKYSNINLEEYKSYAE